MGNIDFAGSGVLVALVAVVAGMLCLAGALYLAAQRGAGVFQYFAYGVLTGLAVLIVFSGRSLSLSYEMQSRLLSESNPVTTLVTRLVSAFLVVASLERIGSFVLRRHRPRNPPTTLLIGFVVFWSTTVASPALLAANGSFSHVYLYTLLMGCAALLLNETERHAALIATRNSLLVFLAISVTLIPLRPTLVIESGYTAGLLPGLPRFAGLAPHPVALGMLAQVALLCLYTEPVRQRWLNPLCWALGLFALFLAQSKASWLSFPVCAACLFFMRGDLIAWRGLAYRHQRPASLLFPLTFLGVVVGLCLAYGFGEFGLTVDSFLAGQQGAELASLTGRDRVWAAALAEWARHPVFGYGTSLFDEAYRTDIGMPFATNGHNQVLDTLARSGLVGVGGLAIYGAVLLVFSVKRARASRGLSLAVFVAIALLSVSEVPLGVFNYGPDVLQHCLFLTILAGETGARSATVPPAEPPATLLRSRQTAH
jgi:O-antigen ligase